jgi:hypothetical protein
MKQTEAVSEFQQLRNKDAKYTLCYVFVIVIQCMWPLIFKEIGKY